VRGEALRERPEEEGERRQGSRGLAAAATPPSTPTSCMQVLSTIISVYSMSGYFLATAWHAWGVCV
jgi:hypothetical protein